jgi:hypothetical protein
VNTEATTPNSVSSGTPGSTEKLSVIAIGLILVGVALGLLILGLCGALWWKRRRAQKDSTVILENGHCKDIGTPRRSASPVANTFGLHQLPAEPVRHQLANTETASSRPDPAPHRRQPSFQDSNGHPIVQANFAPSPRDRELSMGTLPPVSPDSMHRYVFPPGDSVAPDDMGPSPSPAVNQVSDVQSGSNEGRSAEPRGSVVSESHKSLRNLMKQISGGS